MPIPNAEIARQFRELADLLEVEGANPFRVRAYRNAARTIEASPQSIADLARRGGVPALDALPGIGADLAGKIVEIATTGALEALARERRALPKGITTLLEVPGIGPKRARQLALALGVTSLAGLERAAREGRVRALPGFGAVTEAKLLRALRQKAGEGRRFLRSVAAQYGEALLEHLRAVPGVERAEIAGSYRRCRDTVGDLDLLVTCAPRTPVVERFVTWPEVAEVLARGPTRAAVRLRAGLQVDLRVLRPESYGAGLYYFTGSKAHNIAVRSLAQARGLKLNEYGVFKDGRRVAGATEEEVARAVGLPLIPPELREDRGEIAAAQAGALPVLVELRDLRGDLQMHTTDSDGADSLEAMAEAAEALGHEYIAVTDHSPLVRVARGLDAAGFRRQRRRIDRLNARLRTLTVLAGAEVDIRPDGTLDLDDGTLAALDVVVATMHVKLDLPPDAQTRRVVRALRHPAVDILGHPTGRELGRRPGARFDFEQVLAAAADLGVMLEINAQPERLDLDDVMARAAVARGVPLVISTDAHAAGQLGLLRWGVDQARRAWATRSAVANTEPLSRFRRRLHGTR